MFKCPRCDAVIEHLDYTAAFTEYGRLRGEYNLYDEDWHESDRDYHEDSVDDYCYYCPECDSGVMLGDMEDIEEEEEEQTIGLNTNGINATKKENAIEKIKEQNIKIDEVVDFNLSCSAVL